MASSSGPSKILYAIGGWILGGVVGGAVGTAVTLLLAPLLGPLALTLGYMAGAFCTIGGAVMGWKKAAQEHSGAPVTVSTTTTSRSMADEAAPELTREQALALAEAPQLSQEPSSPEMEEEQKQETPIIHEPKPQRFTESFKPTVSKAETVQAERAEPQERQY